MAGRRQRLDIYHRANAAEITSHVNLTQGGTAGYAGADGLRWA